MTSDHGRVIMQQARVGGPQPQAQEEQQPQAQQSALSPVREVRPGGRSIHKMQAGC